MKKIKKVSSYILMFMFMFILPFFVSADETAQIKIIKNLKSNTPDGTFTFNVQDSNGTVLNNDIKITTDSGTGYIIISGLSTNTEYIVEEIDIPSTYEFISIDSNSKTGRTLNSTQALAVQTGTSNSTVEVIVTNGSKVEHGKNIISNLDGTYQLSLDVIGQVDTNKKTAKANILLIYDTSYSMVDNETALDGKTVARATAAERTVHNFIDNMLGYNATNPDNVELALVTFSDTKYTHKRCFNDKEEIVCSSDPDYWTKSTALAEWFSETTYNNDEDTSITGGHMQRYVRSSKTNWEAALTAALDVLDKADDDPTYVIFITDGAPTADNSSSTGSPNIKHYKAALEEVLQIRNGTKDENGEYIINPATLYGIYAFGTEADYLDDLIYYANEGEERENITDATEIVDNYYNAADSSSLQNAIDEIFTTIAVNTGIGSAVINDGTTQSVPTVSGEVANLLTIDPNSFEYWLTFPIESNGKIKIEDLEITFTKNSDGTYKFTWTGETENNVDVIGYCDNNPNADCSYNSTVFNYKWDGATDFYNKASPNATITNGNVVWNLQPLGLLLDKVKYTVKFNVWPSQYAYDLIADLKNGVKDYDDVDPNIRKYLIKNGDDYTLHTNTEAKLIYDDSRVESSNQEVPYVNPSPIGVNVQEVIINKEWQNTLDDKEVDSVTLKVIKNDVENGTIVVLSNKTTPVWQSNVFLSTGILSITNDVNGNPVATVLESGYDYSFKEYILNQNNQLELGYHWDLVVDTMHPMIINGTLTTLIKVNTQDNVTVADIGSSNILQVGENTYYKICKTKGQNGEFTENCDVYKVNDSNNIITVTNKRRSNLNLIKTVIGDAPEDTIYTFELEVNSSEDLWFSVSQSSTDFNPIISDTLVSGENVQSTDGYYNIKSGTKITVNMKKNWNLRFTNIPIGTTYTFKELALLSNFILEDITINPKGVNDTIDLVTAIVNGTISESNTIYNVTYTNRYLLTEVTVTKEWKSSDGTTNVITAIPENVTVKITSSDGTTNEEVILNSTNNWTKTWSGLTKYVKKGDTYETITYTVEEIKVIDVTLPADGIYLVYDSNNALIGKWNSTSSSETVATGTNYTITNTYEKMPNTTLSFIKIQFNSIKRLPGATFVLYRYKPLTGTSSNASLDTNSNDWSYIGTVTSDSNGLVEFSEKLYSGEYRLIEIESPSGYILPSGEWKIFIASSPTNPQVLNISFNATDTSVTPAVINDNSGTIYIPNEQIPTIPTTGGRGIINYSLLGILIVIIGIYFYIVNKRNLIKNN